MATCWVRSAARSVSGMAASSDAPGNAVKPLTRRTTSPYSWSVATSRAGVPAGRVACARSTRSATWSGVPSGVPSGTPCEPRTMTPPGVGPAASAARCSTAVGINTDAARCPVVIFDTAMVAAARSAGFTPSTPPLPAVSVEVTLTLGVAAADVVVSDERRDDARAEADPEASPEEAVADEPVVADAVSSTMDGTVTGVRLLGAAVCGSATAAPQPVTRTPATSTLVQRRERRGAGRRPRVTSRPAATTSPAGFHRGAARRRSPRAGRSSSRRCSPPADRAGRAPRPAPRRTIGRPAADRRRWT